MRNRVIRAGPEDGAATLRDRDELRGPVPTVRPPPAKRPPGLIGPPPGDLYPSTAASRLRRGCPSEMIVRLTGAERGNGRRSRAGDVRATPRERIAAGRPPVVTWLGAPRVQGGGAVNLRIGTSGFDYPHWQGRFYPPGVPSGERLAFYADRFDAVELNVTFYRLPPARAFAAWRDAVPDRFRFAVKASRYLTHVRRLQNPHDPVERLLEPARRLEECLGPILLQLPPDMPIQLGRLDETLSAFPADVRVAVEPRHRSWFCAELVELLGRHRAALCLADRRGPTTPRWRTTDWVYVRLHEGRASPAPCYGRTALRSWIDRIDALWPGTASGYVFFNNDARACAVDNALAMRRMIDRRGREPIQ